MLDSLHKIMSYKTLHALCSTNKNKQLKVVYYVVCLAAGRAPLWGCWSVNGKFLHFAPSRDVIGKMHPHLTWRRVMARWQLADDVNSKAQERRLALAEELRSKLPEAQDEPLRVWNPEMVIQ